MKNVKRTNTVETSAASMADIAFLLLIFFMVTTTIVNDKGLDLLLPPYREDIPITEVHERNIYKILINSDDQILAESERLPSYKNLHDDIEAFILNKGRDPKQSDSPKEAIISIKTNRGTSHGTFIKVLDEAKAAYYEIYAKEMNLRPEDVRKIDSRQPELWRSYKQLKRRIPMNISIAEPDF